MPWKIISLVQGRCHLVKLLLKAQEPVRELCRLFGVSRQTAYKWKERFLEAGRRGLRDRSRRPKHSPGRWASCWVQRIRQLRRRHRRWGAKKIHAVLRRQHPRQRVPAVRTITLWLQRLGLTKARRRRPPKGPTVVRPKATVPQRSNQVWTVDFKGWWRTANGQRSEPLTVRDLFSRYLLAVRLLPDQQWWRVQVVFRRLFRHYGLPQVIRVDNGGPFASVGPAGLSRLSAWWTVLGIRVDFTRPAHPEDNGAHEQMHRVLKAEATHPASSTLRAQQRRLDRWRRTYNQERPHETLRQRTPAQCYRRGGRKYQKPPRPWRYPKGWEERRVRSNGQIRWRGRLRFVGEAFVGFKVGIKPLRFGKSVVYLSGTLLGEVRTTDAGGLRPAAYVRQHPPQRRKKV
jgi:putative transposase